MNKYKTFTVVLLLLSNLLYSQKDDYSLPTLNVEI